MPRTEHFALAVAALLSTTLIGGCASHPEAAKPPMTSAQANQQLQNIAADPKMPQTARAAAQQGVDEEQAQAYAGAGKVGATRRVAPAESLSLHGLPLALIAGVEVGRGGFKLGGAGVHHLVDGGEAEGADPAAHLRLLDRQHVGDVPVGEAAPLGVGQQRLGLGTQRLERA